jgi:hypothetical protein
METKLNLYEKIQAVSNEIKGIEKDMTVGSGNYSYKAVSDTQVTLKVKEAETKHRVLSIPIKQELLSSEVHKTLKKDNTEGLTFVENIKLTLRIIDLDDTSQFIDVESFGKGVDTSDKGFGKASTYARKYSLLNAYKIATGEDPDSEAKEQAKTAKMIDEKIVALKNYYEKNSDDLQKMLERFNIGSFEDFTNEDIKHIYDGLKGKGKL